MEYVVVAGTLAALAVLVRTSLDRTVARRAFFVLLLAFAARLLVHIFVTRGGLIEYGGDNLVYEARATEVIAVWRSEGFHFVTGEEKPELAGVAFLCNLFAVVMYLCGGPAPLACTAVVALVACALCVVMYRFARSLGADPRASFLLLVVTAFLPSFLFHTSDTYKDGFNAFLVVASLYVGVSIARRLDVRRLLVLGSLLWALWNVRAYMVIMCVLPLAVSLLGVERRISRRRLFTLCALFAAAVFLCFGVLGGSPVEMMTHQLATGQSAVVRHASGAGGSGVSFDDGGNAWSALGPKLVYTLFSPFPWSSGSQALQLGKLEVLVWCFLLYAAVRGARILWRTDRRILLILLLFVVPSTVVYATTMANVGLMFRQRMPIVMVAILPAAVLWTRNSNIGRQSNASAEIEPSRI